MRKVRPLALILTASLALAACSSKPEKRVYGRWALDVEANVTKENLKGELAGLDADAQEKRLAAARAEAVRVLLEIDEGKLVADTGTDRLELRYTAREHEGVLYLDTEDAQGRKETFQFRTEGNRLRMNWGGQDLVLVKK